MPMNVTSNLINLTSLFELSTALLSAQQKEQVFHLTLLTLMGKLRVMKVAICEPVVTREEKQIWRIVHAKGKFTGVETFEYSSSGETMFHVLEPDVHADLVATGVQCVMQIRVHERRVGLILLGKNMLQQPYTEEEQQYMTLVTNIVAGALVSLEQVYSIEESRIYVEKKNQLLTTLFEISREFAAVLKQEDILRLLSFYLMGQLTVSKFAFVVQYPGESPVLVVDRLRSATDDPMLLELFTILNEAEHSAREHTREQSTNERVQYLLKETSVAMHSTMLVNRDTAGLLLLGAKMTRRPFSDEENDFINALGSIALTALENARLFTEEIEKKRIEEELNIARQIQQNLLPADLPSVAGFDIAALNIPARHVGGDYYDVVELDNQRVLFIIADVSGKGTPASLLMANTQAALRALSPIDMPLPEMIMRINDLLFRNTASDKFVTSFCCVLDIATKILLYVNAGHNQPYLLKKDGRIFELREGGLILGIMECIVPYQQAEVQLDAGDLLLLYTDGISEALDVHSVEYGDERLQTAMRTARNVSEHQTAQGLLEVVMDDVRTHVGYAPQSDDMTMIAVRCL
jgi:sigma-B regulation protein RsbU (phosphoserine phosphatase)